MSIESVLRKEGIEDVKPLDTLTINKIAKNIAKKLSEAFKEQELDESELFISISRLKMYFAKMPYDSSGAKYFYRNNAIYFNDKFEIDELEEFAMHECIHSLQELKDEKGNLIRLGLYNLKNNRGLAINEAAVQLMTAVASQKQEDKVKYYDIQLTTKSPDYYPLQCTLLNQMLYFTGYYPLYHSTLHSDDVFKNTFIIKYGNKAYSTIEKNIDTILELENTLNNNNVELQYTNSQRRVKQINESALECKRKITKTFIETQDYIMENCFNAEFEQIKTIEELRYFKDKIYKFKDFIGYTENYLNYNNYYIRKMQELEIRKMQIENGELDIIEEKTQSSELVDIQTVGFSFIRRIFIKLRDLIGLSRKAERT